MSRKSRKGFYVKGEFTTESPEPVLTSRTARKKASERLQEIGELLVTAKPALVAGLPLPERLYDAVCDARDMNRFGARRRQLQFIGKLMRSLEPDEVEAICTALGIPGIEPEPDTPLPGSKERP